MIDFAIYSLVFVGAVFVLIVGAAAFIFACEWFRQWLKSRHEPSYWEGREDARNLLAQDAWWFSESPETCDLIRNLANGMGVDNAREKWRKARAESKVS